MTAILRVASPSTTTARHNAPSSAPQRVNAPMRAFRAMGCEIAAQPDAMQPETPQPEVLQPEASQRPALLPSRGPTRTFVSSFMPSGGRSVEHRHQA